jgi:hypothetical protein
MTDNPTRTNEPWCWDLAKELITKYDDGEADLTDSLFAIAAALVTIAEQLWAGAGTTTPATP